MSLRILATALFCLASIALIATVLWSYVGGTAEAQAKPSRLDVPWVSSASADDVSPDESTTLDELRSLAGDSRATPEQRCQAIHLLAKANDWEGVETLIAQLDDPTPLVRGRAAAAVRHILGTDFYYRAEDDRSKRLAAIDGIRRYWQSRKANPPVSE